MVDAFNKDQQDTILVVASSGALTVDYLFDTVSACQNTDSTSVVCSADIPASPSEIGVPGRVEFDSSENKLTVRSDWITPDNEGYYTVTVSMAGTKNVDGVATSFNESQQIHIKAVFDGFSESAISATPGCSNPTLTEIQDSSEEIGPNKYDN